MCTHCTHCVIRECKKMWIKTNLSGWEKAQIAGVKINLMSSPYAVSFSSENSNLGGWMPLVRVAPSKSHTLASGHHLGSVLPIQYLNTRSFEQNLRLSSHGKDTVPPIFLQKIGGPIVGIYTSLTETWKWKLGTRLRSVIFLQLQNIWIKVQSGEETSSRLISLAVSLFLKHEGPLRFHWFFLLAI